MVARRTLIKALPLSVLFGWPTTSPADALNFKDVPKTHAFYNEITWAVNHGYISANEEGMFHPDGSIDRKEIATIFYNYWGRPEYTPPNIPYFQDVPKDHPQYKEISWCVKQQIVKGWADQTFRPDYPVTRDAAAAFLYRLSGSPHYTVPAIARFHDVHENHVFYKEISWLSDMKITNGYPDGTFLPQKPIERFAICAFLYRTSQIFG